MPETRIWREIQNYYNYIPERTISQTLYSLSPPGRSQNRSDRSNAAARAPNVLAFALHIATRDESSEVRQKGVWTALRLGRTGPLFQKISELLGTTRIQRVKILSRWMDAGDEFLCVAEWARWTKDADTSELKCVDECPDWWYSSENGLCKEEIWRKNTAIAVPIAAAVVIAAVVVAVILVKRRAKGAYEAKPAGVMRDNVVNS